jgi:hypothetical protein
MPDHSRPRTTRPRLWIEVAAASLAGPLAVLTLFWPDWIETVFRVDPDHGSGALEWAIVVALALVAVIAGFMARREWVRGLPPATEGA